MPLILGTNSIKDTGFNVGNSLRQNRADSSFLSKTFSGDGTHHDKGTISVWVKRSETGAEAMIYSAGASGREFIRFETNDTLTHRSLASSFHLNTNRVFRDTSAWYHIVVAFDSSQGTASNRQKIYVNGVQETSFATETYQPNQNTDHKILSAELQRLGKDSEQNGPYANCYFCEVVGIDGVAHTPTSFGEFDEDSGIWKPISVSGLTFGTNGFHLNFADSSALGTDVSGNDNTFANTNFAATDQTTDTCTNNFATINPLDNFFAVAVLTEGNTKVVTNATAEAMSTGTFALSAGRWYFEVDIIARGSTAQVGITPHGSKIMSGISGKAGDVTPHARAYLNTGKVQTGDGSGGQTDLATLSSFTTGDIIGVYVDLEDMEFYVSKNGTLQNSGTGLTITALDANEHDVSGGSGHYLAYVGDNTSGTAAQMEVNFGNPHQTQSTSVSDDNGYGAFEYSPNITGDSVAKKFYAICTKNLAEFG